MPTIPSVKLHNGVEIPVLGFGVFLVKPEETVATVSAALSVGYRHIDTAEMYGNEREVGEAIARAELARSEVFVTSKLNNNKIGYDAALRAFDQTLEALGLDQIDLFLIHWPLATVRDYVESWRAFETIYSEGRARAIGVSNFQIPHLERVIAECDVVPHVNQIEVHPYLTQVPLRSFNADHDIATEAWSPIARGMILDDATITEIAETHHKTLAQTALRWHLQLGNIIFPKTLNRSRMEENLDLFDFELSEEEMSRISSLNRDERVGPDPDTFDRIPPG